MCVEDFQYSAKNLLHKMIKCPFNQELSSGILSKDKFVFYLQQDALYLSEFSKALALTAARLGRSHQSLQFIEFSHEALKAESELHVNYFSRWNVGKITQDKQSPACFMYTNYVLKTASMASIEEAVAALLPCFWVYLEVGKAIALQQKKIKKPNPYSDWIALYSGEAFEGSVNAAIKIVNQLGEDTSAFYRAKMKKAFMRAMQLEWIFWDSAYRLEIWPI